MPHQPKDEQLAVVIPSDLTESDRHAGELVRIAFNLWGIGISALSLKNRFKDKQNFLPKMQAAYRWLCVGRLATFALGVS